MIKEDGEGGILKTAFMIIVVVTTTTTTTTTTGQCKYLLEPTSYDSFQCPHINFSK